MMKSRFFARLATVFLCLFFVLPLCAQTTDKPRLAVFGFMNQTGDEAFTIPADTASSNLLVTMKTLNQFQISEPDTIPRSLTNEGLTQWCARNNIDFVLFGTLTKKPDETQEYQIAYFSQAEKKITNRKNATGESVNDVFSVTDTLVDSLLETIVRTKVSFGSLAFANTGIKGEYDVFLNDIFIQTSPAKFERIPTGSHAIRIVQKETGKEILKQTITVAQGKSAVVSFALKEPVPSEIVKTVTVVAPEEPKTGTGTYQEGYADGELMAPKRSVPYFFSGCCLGVIGIVIPAVVEPTIPSDAIIGKSGDYITGFNVGYKGKAKNNNVRSAVVGFATTSCVGCVAYIAVIAYASSLTASSTAQ